MLLVGVRGSRRDKDKGKGRRRLEEVRVFLDLGFEREKSGWRIFFFWISVFSGKVNKANVFQFFYFYCFVLLLFFYMWRLT